MKRIISIILAALFIVCLFSACGSTVKNGDAAKNEDSAESAAGKYVVSKLDGKSPSEGLEEHLRSVGSVMDMKGMLGLSGLSSVDEYFTVELKSDGTVKAVAFTSGSKIEGATWAQDGNKVTITSGSDAYELTLNGNQLTGTYQDFEVVMDKK